MEPVECYAARKLVDLASSVGPSSTALVGLRNLAVFLAHAYGVSLDEAGKEPEPGYYLILNAEFLPDEEEKEEKAWKQYKDAMRLAATVLARLAKLCRERTSSI